MEVFRLQGSVGINPNEALTGLQRVSNQARNTQSTLSRVGTGLSNMGAAVAGFGKKLTAGVTLPLAGAAVASFNMAADMNESVNKVDTVFGNNSTKIKNWANESLKSFGIAKGSALEMTALFGDMAVGMGLNTTQATDMSMKLAGLAGDLASFKNVRVDVAQTALAGVFTGETESLKQLGIVMTEANLQEYAHAQGINKKVSEMNQAEKVQLRYNYVMDQTKLAQGDFAKTSSSASNQVKIFWESLKELAATLGSYLLPIITPIVQKVNEFVQHIIQSDSGTHKWILALGALAMAIGPVLLVLGGFLMFIGNVITAITTISGALATAGGIAGVFGSAMGVLSSIFAFITGPIGITVAAIGVFVGALIKAYNENESFRNKVNSVFNQIKSIISNVMSIVKDIISMAWSLITFIWNNGLSQILGFVGSILASIVGHFTSKLNRATTIVKNVVSLIKAIFSGDFKGASTIVNNILHGIVQSFNNKMEQAKQKVSSAIQKIKGFFNFHWSLPKLKMPHVNISGSFSLNPPSVPKFGISWYSKGAIFTKPTLLGNVGVGDANNGMGNGPEAILPIGHLRKYVREEVKSVLDSFNASNQTIYNTTNVNFNDTQLNNNLDIYQLAKELQFVINEGQMTN